MTEFCHKESIYRTLLQPVKLFGKTKIRDKIAALNSLKSYADLSGIKYVFPLVADKNTELASAAAQVVSEIMGRVRGKCWNKVYDEVKYTRIEFEAMECLLNFNEEISVHLLGVASLNSSGYIREKALRILSGVRSSDSVPYVLLRLNDWVLPVRNLAENILNNMLTKDNIEVFIENSYLVDKLQYVLRADLLNERQRIVDFLKDDSVKDKIKKSLGHPQVKTRLFCYRLLMDRPSYDEDVIYSALKDKSFEIRMWLVDAIKGIDYVKKLPVIAKLLNDKSAKVATSVLRNFEDIVCIELREDLKKLVVSEYASVRDEARFIARKHLFIEDFAAYYRKQLCDNPTVGALVGLGETGIKSDFELVKSFYAFDNGKIRLAAMTAMWYLSRDEAISYVLKELDSVIPKIKKTARKITLSSKMPVVLYEMKNILKSNNTDNKLFALETICRHGGWQALEEILFAVANWQSPDIERARILLDRWINSSVNLYTRPESNTFSNITDFFQLAKKNNSISTKAINELKFLFETRGI